MYPALQRVYEAVGCRTQVELAQFLGIRQSSISDAKRRKAIPADWLLKILREKGISPDWILTGEGPRTMQAAGYATAEPSWPAYTTGIRSLKECSTEELLTEIVRRALKNIR